MKKVCFFIALFISSLILHAESRPVEMYSLKNKIPVYVKNIPGNKINVVYAVVKGGTAYLTERTSGLEDAVVSMMKRGSEKYSYQELQSFEYDTMSRISGWAGRDGCVFGITSISSYFDSAFDRFADSFLNPLFSRKQYELVMTSYSQNIQNMLNNPDSMLFYYAGKIIYEGHPYAVSASVTPDSLEHITLENIKAHHKTILDSRRISIVAVGDFDTDALIKKLDASFGLVEAGKTVHAVSKIPAVKIDGENAVFVHQSAGETAYIARCFSSPDISSPDYPVSHIVCDIYSDILYNVVRENYGVCYSPRSSVLSSKAPFGFEFLYRASNFTSFSKYIAEARSFMEQGKVVSGRDSKGNYVFDSLDAVLPCYINSYINKKYASAQRTQALADRMSSGLLQGSDVCFSDKLTELAEKTTAEDIIRVFKKYWLDEPSRWFAVVSPENEEKISFQ